MIVLDLMLPKLSGLAVLKALRKNRIMTYVLILTTKRQIANRIEGLELGTDDNSCRNERLKNYFL